MMNRSNIDEVGEGVLCSEKKQNEEEESLSSNRPEKEMREKEENRK